MGLTQNLGLLSTAIKATSTLNVGIGTSIPSTGTLVVKQSTNSYNKGFTVESSSNSNYIGMWYNGTSGIIDVSYGSGGSYSPLVFNTSDTERMRITSGGNMLIGTTSDSGRKLTVSGSSLITDTLAVGQVYSNFLSVSTPSGTWTVIGSLPNTSRNYYLMVHARSPSASIGYTSVSILVNYYNGGSAAQSVTQLKGGSYQVRANGGNIEVYQNSGSTMTTYLDYTYFGQTSNAY